jgi:hypothetical protein
VGPPAIDAGVVDAPPVDAPAARAAEEIDAGRTRAPRDNRRVDGGARPPLVDAGARPTPPIDADPFI